MTLISTAYLLMLYGYCLLATLVILALCWYMCEHKDKFVDKFTFLKKEDNNEEVSTENV